MKLLLIFILNLAIAPGLVFSQDTCTDGSCSAEGFVDDGLIDTFDESDFDDDFADLGEITCDSNGECGFGGDSSKPGWNIRKTIENAKFSAVNLVRKSRFLTNNTTLGLLQIRCHRLPGLTSFSSAELYCFSAAEAMVQMLDVDIAEIDLGDGDVYHNPVILHNRLIELMSNRSTFTTLSAIKEKIGRATALTKANLWAEVRKTRSKEQAIEFMATVFQDTSEAMSAIIYLQNYAQESLATSSMSQSAKSLLVRNISLLEEVTVSIQELYEQGTITGLTKNAMEDVITVFPKGINNKKVITNLGFYHFWVPAYLAMELGKLKSSRLVSWATGDKFLTPRIAAFVPFLFNYAYEVVSMDEAGFSAAFWEPESISNWYKKNDIIMGYLGPLFALGIIDQAGVKIDESKFLNQLENSPSKLIQDIVSTLAKAKE
jgi:hypothetical protein